ncbi:MAG: adenylate/guanylate cyclase domain-containing protein [Alphaproteobacteria bacterium]|nr:adenylate/guanylate cyclase domain-containing protein [Alphaproteobacteria bacterium]
MKEIQNSPMGQLLKRIQTAVGRLTQAGTADYPPTTKRRLIITNMIGYLSTISSLSYAITYAAHGFGVLKWPILVNLFSAATTASMPFWHRFGSAAGGMVLAVVIFITLFYFTYFFGRESGIHLQYFGAAAAAFLIFGLTRLSLILVIVVSGLVLHVAAQFLFVSGQATTAIDPPFLTQIYVIASTSLTAIVAIVVWYFYQMAADAERRSEQLLHNVLPVAVAEQLKDQPGEMIAQRYDEVTVLFADLEGFTPLSRTMEASEIVELLNAIFVRFDEATAAAGVEKIKTIGDAYMAVGGLPEVVGDHAHRIASLALEMRSAIAEVAHVRDLHLNIRVGIATGPVAAGVIGQAKFAYDVWGDTVNLAARLESAGEVGRIHVSNETRTVLETSLHSRNGRK